MGAAAATFPGIPATCTAEVAPRIIRSQGDAVTRDQATNAELRRLMGRHKLTRVMVAQMLGVSIRQDTREGRPGTQESPTVSRWLADPASARYSKMPGPMLELLRLKLAEARRKRRQR